MFRISDVYYFFETLVSIYEFTWHQTQKNIVINKYFLAITKDQKGTETTERGILPRGRMNVKETTQLLMRAN